MDSILDLLNTVAGNLEDASQSDVVVGQAIDLGKVQIVPLSRLSLGLGVGGGEGQGEVHAHGKGRHKHRGGKGKGRGAATGMGAKIRPVGVAIFTEDGVEVLPIADRKGILDKIFDKIPDVIDMVERVTGKDAPAKDA
ncbi:MAG: GerW family sporulation protein [Bradymonadia bacterium]